MDGGLNIISIHSRKGGVGKTSIALSCAIQLAGEGRKVAYLDLDSLGSHLGQCLPYAQDLRSESDHFTFSASAFDSSPEYKLRKTVFGRISRNEISRRQLKIGELVQTLSPGALNWAAEKSDGWGHVSRERLQRVVDNLWLFPGSVRLNQMLAMNNLVPSPGGQERFLTFLTNFATELIHQGIEYLVVDAAPGLTFLPSVYLAWMFKQRKGLNHQVLFVGSATWWDLPLILYEINPFVHRLPELRPTMVVNRIQDTVFNRTSVFRKVVAGERINLPKLFSNIEFSDDGGKITEERGKEILEIVTGLPIWMAAANVSDQAVIDRLIKTANLELAALSEDSDHQTDMFSDPPWAEDLPLEKPIRWASRSSDFGFRFVKRSLEAASPKCGKTLHKSIRTALLSQEIS